MENKVVLNIKEIFSYSFEKAKKNFLPFAASIFAFMVVAMIEPNEKTHSFRTLRSLISLFGSVYLSMAMYNAVFKIIKEEAITVKDFFTWPVNGFKTLWAEIVSKLIIAPVFFAMIIIAMTIGFTGLSGIAKAIVAAVFIGALFAVMLHLTLRLMFAKYFALEKGYGVKESIKASWSSTKGNTGRILWVSIVGMGIVILGILALLVGLFLAIPIVVISQMVMYKKLTNSSLVSSEIAGGSILPEVQPLELEANPSVIDAQN